MRRRILTVALPAVVLAVALLGVPLGFAIQRNAVNEERGELERAALRGAVAVSPSYRSGDQVELPGDQGAGLLGVYSIQGHKVIGTGPATLEPSLRAARQGRVVDGTTSRDMIEAVPVSVNENVIAIVRASSTRASVRATVVRELLGIGGVILIALAAAGVLSFWGAKRLTRAMQDLADVATELGAGNFVLHHTQSGVPEIDRTAAALAATAHRLETQIARERAFAARASHQLRTPLTRLQLELEAGLAGEPARLDDAVHDALNTAGHLSRTIDDVLALTRESNQEPSTFDIEELLDECALQWRGVFATDDRPLRLVIDNPELVAASRNAVRQVLHVLIDNAYRHGRGVVTITARNSGGAVAIDVSDQGTSAIPWPTQGEAPGRLGLAMARSIAESQSGRLLLASDARGTRFTLLVPAAKSDQPG